MTDSETNPREAIGGNNPPEEIDTWKAKANEFGRGAETWAKAGVQDPQDAEGIKQFIADTTTLWTELDAERKAKKKPHDDAAAAVQATYSPILTLLDGAKKKAKAVLTAFLQAEEDRQRAAERKRQQEAAEREAAERERARQAEDTGDLLAAAAAREAAEKAAAAAEKSAPVKAQVRGGTGPAVSMRTVRVAKIVNPALLVAHYRKHAEVLALVERLANADIRAAKGGSVEIPGVEIVTERRVA